jgi:hypothetical protein
MHVSSCYPFARYFNIGRCVFALDYTLCTFTNSIYKILFSDQVHSLMDQNQISIKGYMDSRNKVTTMVPQSDMEIFAYKVSVYCIFLFGRNSNVYRLFISNNYYYGVMDFSECARTK